MKLSKNLVIALLLANTCDGRPVVDSIKDLVSNAPRIGYIQNKINKMEALKPKIESANDQVKELLKNPPADEIPDAPVFAPKEVEPVIPKFKAPKTHPCVIPEPVEEEPAEEPCVDCHGRKHVHHNHAPPVAPPVDCGGDGMKAIARTTLDIMGPEPIDQLSRRAMGNVQRNGVTPEAREMAKSALQKLDGDN